jgi:uncharacterized protein YggE
MQNQKILTTVGVIFLALSALYLGVLTRNAMKTYDYIGISEQQRHSITITGEGRVVGIPDVAEIQLGYGADKKTVAEGQKEVVEKMNAMTEKLKKDFNIDTKDIQTANYSINPEYDWSDGRQTLRGYKVSENLSLKIRKMEQVSDILAVAGTLGLNQVGGLTFTIDDPENLKQQAREKAIKAAKAKAEALAEIAGVKLGRIISFNESSNEAVPIYRGYGMLEAKAVDSVAVPSPQIEAGSSEIVINATVEYEIL